LENEGTNTVTAKLAPEKTARARKQREQQEMNKRMKRAQQAVNKRWSSFILWQPDQRKLALLKPDWSRQ
jgi:hypothetical protein